ncbi:MAG TPA: hypothetical protein VHQ03_09170 [Candidatus Dormibacteraeota bacterium]|nr:hypothetical protein [Candidatus Dormibacteraeota bacterium]
MEIYFSIVQRKVLTPNDFTNPGEIEARVLAFQAGYEQVAQLRASKHWRSRYRPPQRGTR